MEQTQNINVASTMPLVIPSQLEADLPMTEAANRTVIQGRKVINDILAGNDDRLLVVIGPCSIHDVDAALEYANRLAELREKVNDRLYVVMRVYFEKPRTTVGWKGLINDPHLDDSFEINEGLRLARKLLLDVTTLGLPTGTEILDPITPQYIDDLISWTAIGARTTESQTHRQMASGLSMPVGYKNSTEGNLQIAIDAMEAARHPHHFLGIDEKGQSCIVKTKGNTAGHVILRGGHNRTNYDPENVAEATRTLEAADLPAAFMIDCSHANSGKKHERQEIVWTSLIEQRAAGQKAIIGAMLESNIHEGNQKLPADRSQLKYGVSITDACISWEKTEELLLTGYEQLG